MKAADTVIVGRHRGFPVKKGEAGWKGLAQAFDAAPKPERKRKLRAARPNHGITLAYRRKIMCLVKEMSDSVEYWLRAAYRANEPAMAQDATPAGELQVAVNRLARQWQRNINDAAPLLARWFAKEASKRSDAMLQRILRDAGISVRFKWRMTAQMRDVFNATVHENVGLIKSIPQQYLGEVQGLVMRSVQSGRDLGTLTRELQKRYGITERRAALIALNQNNQATAAMQRVRQTELGIEEAVWLHSHAGKEPRPTHLANDGKRYKIATGWFDPDPKVRKHIWPGQLINCRCVSRPIVKGFS